MNAYKARIKLKDLKKVIDVPQEITSADVEIIILSEGAGKASGSRTKKYKNLGGVFHEFAKPELIDREKDIAWTRAIGEKHGLL